ncbi:MAG: hypothetical protein JO122_15990 [Acetobacteraceae bacterium]|nr:hypothetical protein [Acetobacteraceae bacterium]
MTLADAWEQAIRAGDFEAAWRINDRVLAERGEVPDDPRLPYHLRFVWDGRPFAGCDVLVRCYHGLGDTLQFARYIPLLRKRVARVTLQAQSELVPLLRSLPGVDRLMPFRVDQPLPPAECDIEVMELSHALRLPPETAPPPYLAVSEEKVREARQRLGAGLLIGLCGRCGGWNPGRSVPVEVLARAVPEGARLVKLERGACRGIGWVNPDDPLDGIMHSAALVCAVDLVVAADTMIAHLAGALGRPVFLLLQHRADWRWMEGRRDSPWYPRMRIYRQRGAGSWLEPLEEVRRDLAVTAIRKAVRAELPAGDDNRTPPRRGDAEPCWFARPFRTTGCAGSG